MILLIDTHVTIGASLSDGRFGLHASHGDGGNGIESGSGHLSSDMQKRRSLSSKHGRNSAD